MQCLLDAPPRDCGLLWKLLSRIQRLYKMAKFDKQSLCEKYIYVYFAMTLLHAHAHYICIVYAKYQKASVKALVQVDVLMCALSKHKHNPYLKGNRKKMAKFTKLSFCQKLIFWHQTSSYKCSMCLYCVNKYQIVSAKAMVQVDFPAYEGRSEIT